ncbi:LOW QUALITY PROTEIN: dapper homolog 3 [Tachyglossus aculeatus]|uniref:LOW QUALITY PROTEIN: dapper homolog 3 n=1 Tax=Tachyglossus aculeatus TaxID=9261 RepID=UPI0018F331F5|nr:LOW QUALITY PROTEIN: dapper homolog 3 [Tachyglossus aculeatus]
MIRAFSFPVSPERGRLRSWLEGSLAGLCELHLLRERQELRVQRALRLGPGAGQPPEPGPGGAGEDEEDEGDEETARRAAAALEEQLEALPGLMWQLGQQLGELSLDPDGGDMDTGSWPSSGFYEGPGSAAAPDSPPPAFGGDSGFSGSGSYGRLGPAEPRGAYACERPKSVGDSGPSPRESAVRGMVPRSLSAPYPSGPDGGGGDRRPPFLCPSPLHAVALQSPLPCGRAYADSPFSAGPALGFPLEGPAPPADFGPDGLAPDPARGRRVENYITGLLRRRGRAGKPRTHLGPQESPAPPPAPRRQNSLRQRPAEPSPPGGPARPPPPPPPERRSGSSSPCGYEAGPGVALAARGWASWDSERRSPPPPLHSSLPKPPRLQAAPRPALSMDLYPGPGGAGLDAYEAGLARLDAAGLPSGLASGLPSGLASGLPPGSPPPSPGEEQLVKAQYIPAQAGARGPTALHHRAARRKGAPPLAKGRSFELSPPRERPRPAGAGSGGGPKKCRFTEGAGGGRRGSPRGKKAARSQSENSLLNRPGAAPGAPKYHTVEREEPRPPRPRRAPHGPAPGPAGYRKWRSTAEISRDEGPGGPGACGAPPADGRRGKRAARVPGASPPPPPPPRPLLYGYGGSDSECSAGRAGAPGRRGPAAYGGLGYGDSESSLSEGESPAFSSGSSDTDGSGGGLVWPQQLAPQLVAAAGPGGAGPGGTAGQPKVFVKIKASHALKKKILRFRSGSLKVMTTV